MEPSFGILSNGTFMATVKSATVFAEEDDDECFDGGSLQVGQNQGSAGCTYGKGKVH